MKTKQFRTMLAGLLIGQVAWAGIPEPSVVLYGVVKQNIGGATIRCTAGELSLTVIPPTGDPVSISVELQNINDQFCYALELPFESVLGQMNVSSNTLKLTPLTLPYQCTSIQIEGDAVSVLEGSGTFTLSQSDRGSFQRLDLLLEILPADSDGDGLSDDWEDAHFYGYGDANGDEDGDGVSNLKEYLAGTNPWDASSFLSFMNVEQADGEFIVRWSSEPNRYYRVERSDSLMGGFVPVATGISATTPVNEYRDPHSPTDQSAFYRIVVE